MIIGIIGFICAIVAFLSFIGWLTDKSHNYIPLMVASAIIAVTIAVVDPYGFGTVWSFFMWPLVR